MAQHADGLFHPAVVVQVRSRQPRFKVRYLGTGAEEEAWLGPDQLLPHPAAENASRGTSGQVEDWPQPRQLT